jgi:hypothetical protein
MRRLLGLVIYWITGVTFLVCRYSQQEVFNDSTPPKQKQAAIAQKAREESGPRWDGVSRLKCEAAPADLNRAANDVSVSREKRAEAIFSLFANHVKPPQGAAAVARVLKGEKWLNEAKLRGVYLLGGVIPVEWTSEDTVFCLLLFPDKEGWSDWVVYFRLSGGSGRTEDEAHAFLRGDKDLKGTPKLVEFALCFPEGKNQSRRIERFAEQGISVLGR